MPKSPMLPASVSCRAWRRAAHRHTFVPLCAEYACTMPASAGTARACDASRQQQQQSLLISACAAIGAKQVEKPTVWQAANSVVVAGEFNWAADRLSRNLASVRNEWSLSTRAMRAIVRRFGQPTMDWFASDETAQCKRFASLLPSTRAVHRDAMKADWTREFGLFVPPINMIDKVLLRLRETGAHGIVVVPAWPSTIWAPQVPWIKSNLLWLPESAMQAVSTTGARHPMRDGRVPQLVAFEV